MACRTVFMSFTPTTLNDKYSAVNFERVCATTILNSSMAYVGTTFPSDFGASISTSSSNHDKESPTNFLINRGGQGQVENSIAAPRVPSVCSSSNNYSPYSSNQNNQNKLAPPLVPHTVWNSGKDMNIPEYVNEEEEQKQQGQKNPHDFIDFNQFLRDIPNQFAFQELSQMSGSVKQTKTRVKRTPRKHFPEFKQATPPADEVDLHNHNLPYFESKGDTQEFENKNKNILYLIEDWKKELKNVQRYRNLTIAEKFAVLEACKQAIKDLFNETLKYHQMTKERWDYFMEMKKAKEQAEMEKDSMVVELRHKLSIANHQITVLTDDLKTKKQNYAKDRAEKDDNAIQLRTEMINLVAVFEKQQKRLESVQERFDNASINLLSLNEYASRKEQEVQNLMENLGLKVEGKNALVNKLFVAEEQKKNLKEIQIQLEQKVEILERDLQAVKDEVEKLRVDSNNAKIMEGQLNANTEGTTMKQNVEEKEDELQEKEEQYNNKIPQPELINLYKQSLKEAEKVDEELKMPELYAVHMNIKKRRLAAELTETHVKMGESFVAMNKPDEIYEVCEAADESSQIDY
ncbi:unnamed protein product [Orchesella dallaii]|uniref:Uncharacterized protein n=1 Tax=Orchesella dallaii TaxID=48710 RepID=A0ABP1S723_9HEXA